MAYRIDPSGALDAEFRRVALEQNRKATRALADPEIGLADAAFETRKHLKKLRGLLRLVRPADRGFASAENARYRATAKTLSAIRDDAMLDHALQSLAQEADPDDIAAVTSPLAADRATAGVDPAAAQELRQRALAQVTEGRAPIEAFILEPKAKPARILARGVAQTYARGRKSHRLARRTRAEDDLHALRGEAKRHWMHLRLLELLWPEVLQPLAGLAKGLADDLGDDHDQAVLRAALQGLGERADPARARLAALSAERSQTLRDRALANAARLYLEKPEIVEARFASLYRLAAPRP